jgi:uncharacterized protein
MAKDPRQSYLGQGLSFPLQLNPRGEIALVGGGEDIAQSIRIILSTRPGERVMRPEFGCRANELLFEPSHASTTTLLRKYVREALQRWEPRIDLLGVDVLTSPDQDGALFVEIEYEIKATHDHRSIVYPFFLTGEEGW